MLNYMDDKQFRKYVYETLQCLTKRTTVLESYHTKVTQVQRIYLPLIASLVPIMSVLLSLYFTGNL